MLKLQANKKYVTRKGDVITIGSDGIFIGSNDIFYGNKGEPEDAYFYANVNKEHPDDIVSEHHEVTLGDILRDALSEHRKENKTMPRILVKYDGKNKINAIKAYREVFGCGLREAKEAIENPRGIYMTRPIVSALELCYTRSLDNIYSRTGTDYPYGAWMEVTEYHVQPADPLNIGPKE